jgi:hypothetical protein
MSLSEQSSAKEKLIEHVFLGELLAELWRRGERDVAVLRPEVDAHGFDIAVEAAGVLRWIQLKAMVKGGKRTEVTINTRLASRPGACVVWMVYDQATLALRPFHFLGGPRDALIPDLGEVVAKHTKANSKGIKTARPRHRVVKKTRFETLPTMEALASRLFGQTTVDDTVQGRGKPAGTVAKSASASTGRAPRASLGASRTAP